LGRREPGHAVLVCVNRTPITGDIYANRRGVGYAEREGVIGAAMAIWSGSKFRPISPMGLARLWGEGGFVPIVREQQFRVGSPSRAFYIYDVGLNPRAAVGRRPRDHRQLQRRW
jgi:hypothetical protein